MSAILISHLKVKSANLHSTGCLLGAPPLMAASQFAHYLARELDVKDEGFVLFHHHRQVLGGFAYGRFTPAQRRGAMFIGKNDYSSKNKYALSLQPTASMHLVVSLIIQFNQQPSLDELRALFNRGRFAGGNIMQVREVKAFDSVDSAYNALPTGFVIQDRHTWLQQYQAEHGVNRLQAMVQLLAQKNPDYSWMTASVVGYNLLEAPTPRVGVREGYVHAYAEPMMGLTQYVSKHQLPGDEPILWTRNWVRPDVYLLQQKSF